MYVTYLRASYSNREQNATMRMEFEAFKIKMIETKINKMINAFEI